MKCVEALLAARTATLGVNCIVVDNASGDGTAAAIESRWPDVTVIRNAVDPGYGRACNQAAMRGSAPFIFILNSDAFVRPAAVLRLVEYLEGHETHAAVGARLVDVLTDQPQVGFAVRGFPTFWSQLLLLLGLERLWPTNPISRRHLMLDFDFDRTQDIEAQPAGACLLCRRAAFEAVGGFREEFFYWFEDVHLVRRLRERGRLGYVHDAVVEHLGGGTFRQWDRPEVVLVRYRSLLRYFEKHEGHGSRLALRSLVAALAIIRAVPLLAIDRRRAHAYFSVIRLATRP